MIIGGNEVWLQAILDYPRLEAILDKLDGRDIADTEDKVLFLEPIDLNALEAAQVSVYISIVDSS